MSFPNTFAAPFVVNPKLTAISIAYRNAKLIADDVLPRVPVVTPSFLYSVYNKGDNFTIPDTKVGRKSDVNQIDFSATQAAANVEDYAIDEVVPNRDKMVATAYGSFVDPEAIAAEQVSDVLALAREQRTANLITTAASYAAANKTTLSGTSQWSDKVNSDPLVTLITAMDSMLMRPNKLVISRIVATQLQTHPKLLAAFHGNQGQSGFMPLSFLQTLLGLDDILVGEGFVNTAVKGQTPVISRIWGKSAALIYSSSVSVDTNSMSFGITAQWGDRLSATYQEPKKGLRGSTIVRVGESVKELILANDLGYLFTNAVA
jgi:hypothetical protein